MKPVQFYLRCANSIATTLFLTCSAYGQTDSATARALFDEARGLSAKQDYAAACPMFEESYRLDPGTGTLLNLADCLEKTGRTASAWARFLEVADMTKRLGQSDRERVARIRAAALEPILSKLRVEVPSPQAGLELMRDGLSFGKAQWGVDLPIDAGRHTIDARAPGKKAWTTTIEVPPSGQKAVLVVPLLSNEDAAISSRLQDDPVEASQRIAPIPAPIRDELGPPANHPTGISPPTWILGGVGAAGLVLGATFAFELRSKNHDADSACPSGQRCTDEEMQRYSRAIDDAKTAQRLSIVGFTVGGSAILASTLVWFLVDRVRPVQGTSIARVGIDLKLGGANASLVGTW